MTPRLQKIMEEMAEAHKEEAFKNNPDGYSVFRGCNEPDVDFEVGFTAGVAERDKELLESVGEFDEKAFEKWEVEYMSNPKNDRMYAPNGKECARWQFNQLKLKLAARDEELAECKIAASVEAKAAEQARKQLASLRKENEQLKNLNGIVCECCTPCDCYLKKLAVVIDAKNWAIDMAASFRDECRQLRTLWECHGDKVEWGPLQNANKIRDERPSDEDVISLSKELTSLRDENEQLKNLNGIVCECCTPCDCYLKKLQTQQQLLKECELVIRDANEYYTAPPAYRKLLGKLTAHLEGK